jgi:F5/8 type C domain
MSSRHILHQTLFAAVAAVAMGTSSMAWADVELTDMPGVTTSANSCYLSACGVTGTFTDLNIIDNLPYIPGTGGHGWSAGDHGTAANPNWVRVDFGAAYLISSVDLRFHDNSGAWQGYNNVYELRGSTDASSWQLLGSGTLTDLTGNVAALTDNYMWAGAARPVARWLEYRVVGGSHWSALDEINAMGSPAAPVPEPGSAALWATAGALGLWLRRRAAAK